MDFVYVLYMCLCMYMYIKLELGLYDSVCKSNSENAYTKV